MSNSNTAHFKISDHSYVYYPKNPCDVQNTRKMCVNSWFDDRSGRLYSLNMDNNTTSSFKFLCQLLVDYGRYSDFEQVLTPNHTEEEKTLMKQQLESLHAKILARMQSEYEKLVEEHKRCMDIIRQA